MDLILGFATALTLSIALTPVFIHFASNLKLVDVPSADRHIHDYAIPRVGGLGIVLATFASVAYWYQSNDYSWTLLSGSAVIVLFGYLDDRYTLSHRWKLFGQILAVLVTLSGGVVVSMMPFFGLDPAPVWLSYPLSFLFILGVVNAVNLSDGMDGLAAGATLISLGLITVFALQSDSYSISLMALGVMGAVLGFLRYNTHPAQVFMGDTGSQFLGYITACLAILVTQHEHNALSPVLPLYIIGLPILDTLLVICIRKYRGHSIFVADQSHIHHQLLSIGFLQYEVVAILYTIQAVFVLLAWNLRYASDSVLLLVHALFCISCVGMIGTVRLGAWTVRERVDPGRQIERRNRWLRQFYWIHLYGAQGIEAMLAVLFVLAAVAYSDGSLMPRWATLCAGVLLIVLWRVLIRFESIWLTRLLAYIASIVTAGTLVWRDESHSALSELFDIYLIVLAAFFALCVRMTRKTEFRIDAQDLLIVFLVMVLPLLPVDNIDRYELGHIAVRLAVLIYACEYVLSTACGRHLPLVAACVVSIAVMLRSML